MNRKKTHQSAAQRLKPVAKSGATLFALRPARLVLPMSLAFGGWQTAQAENQVDYRYEYYSEDNHRMKIETHSVYFEQQLIDSIIAKGELTYDSISGATPVGTVDFSGNPILANVQDIRRAVSLQLDSKLGRQTLTPGFAYSKESDYESYAISLNDAIEFNQKNTILQLGASHNFDSALGTTDVTPRVWNDKQSTEGIIGISQLLTPKTIFTAAFTFGNDSGYLNDPYRKAEFIPTGFPFGIGVPDKRPRHRNKEVLYTSLTYFVEPANASIEGSYRFFHDSYGVLSHTLDLTWHQWLGTHVMLEPGFRFSEQSAADFYTTGFSGPFNPFANPDGVYSSDYRLSEMYTLDYGLQATFIVNPHVHLMAGYHRYEMYGLDAVTPAAMYPKANVFTIGFSILW
jgi:hypothetical protein